MRSFAVKIRQVLYKVGICLFLFLIVHSFVWAQTVLSVADQKKIIEFIKEKYPKKYEEVMALKESHPELYQQSLINAYNVMQQQEQVQSSASDLAESVESKKTNIAESAQSGKPEAATEAMPYDQSSKKKSAFFSTKESSRQKTDVSSFVREEFPEQYKYLQSMKDTDPEAYKQALVSYEQVQNSYEALQKSRPEVFERSQALKKENVASGPIAASEEKEILAFLSKDLPAQYPALIALKEKDPLRYQEQLASYKQAYDVYKNAKKNFPDIFDRMQQGKEERDKMGPLSDSQEKEILSFVAQAFPAQYNSLLTEKKENPQHYQELLKMYAQTQQNYQGIVEKYPEVFKRNK